MKLISFGTSSQATIKLQSQYVSSYHAELFLLDNGDILLVDQNSKNGTFVNGTRVAPKQEIAITRRDQVRFADQPLNWATIPTVQLPDMANIANFKTVGSHKLNNIQIADPKVSRFHATIKQMKNGMWYICDHSSNGTTINGTQIPKDQYVPFKYGDSLACAGVRFANPISNKSGGNKPTGKILAIAAGVVAIIALLLALFVRNEDPAQKLYKKYAHSTVLIEYNYYFRVVTEKYPPQLIVMDYKDEDLYEYNGANAMSGTANGFFIYENGVIVSNLHAAQPWLFDVDKTLEKVIKQIYQRANPHLKISDIKIEGVIDHIYAYPNGIFYDKSNRIPCRVLATSDRKEIDLSLLQTMSGALPEGATYVPANKIAAENQEVGTELFTMGFPVDYVQQLRSIQRPIQVVSATGILSQNNGMYAYLYNATTPYNASGAPIFDRTGKLIGVTAGTATDVQGYNYAIKSKYILQLLDKVMGYQH